MDLTELVNLFMNNGVALGCLIYFMVYNQKQLTAFRETLEELKDLIKSLTNNKNEGGK